MVWVSRDVREASKKAAKESDCSVREYLDIVLREELNLPEPKAKGAKS
jgi:hypothetical protein